jgi:hypothetical protein
MIMTYAFIQDAAIIKTGPRPKWLNSEGQPLTDAELADHGWYRIQDADPIPEGKTSTGTTAQIVDGVPKWVHTLVNVPEPTLAERKQILIETLKHKRWEVETGGVTVPINGEEVLVSTARGDDRTNLHVMMTTITNGMRQDGATFNFADSKPRSVSNADMLTAIGAALSHVQESFNKEAEITNEINAANTHAKLDLALDKINEVW